MPGSLTDKQDIKDSEKQSAELELTSPQTNETDTLETCEQTLGLSDNDWLAMSEDWQSQPFTKMDIQRLTKQTQRRTLWAKVCLTLNTIGTLIIILLFFYGLRQGNFSQTVNIYLGIGSLLALIFNGYELKIRLKAWQTCCESPDKAIQHAMTGIESSIKYCRLTKLSMVSLFILLNWFFYAVSSQSEKSIWPLLIVTNGFVVIVCILSDIIQRKRKAEYQRLENMSKE
jgi:hypothetical protein